MRNRVLRRATMSAAALLLAVSAVAYADVINADGDRVLGSAQTLIDFGTVGAGATITYDVYFLLECRLTAAHAVPGSTISLTPRPQIVAPGGTITATATTIGPVPATWPAAGQPCTGDPVFQSTTPSVVTIVAPMVADIDYIYRLEYLKAPLTGIVGVSTMTFRMDVSTNTAPVVEPIVDRIAEGNTLGGWTATYSATATDAEDGPLAAPCVPAPGSVLPVGQTIVVCTARDSAGASGSTSFRMNVTDTTAPVLSGVPTGAAGDTPDPAGANISWPAPSAVDIVDGTVNVTCAPASGSLFALGSTTVKCSASDTSGNVRTDSFSVDVTLVDTTPPVLSNMPGNISADATAPAGVHVTWTDPSAVDNIDGPISATCAPASGSRFAVGSTTVECSATDAHGNVATDSFSVNVTLIDTTAPALSGVPGDFGMNTTDPTGIVVTWPAPSAVDNLDGVVGVTCSPASGSRFSVGTTTVDCSAGDTHGNVASESFRVTVALRDSTPPVLSGVPADIAVETTDPTGIDVNWTTPSADDNIDGPVSVSCGPASGTRFAIGTRNVTCSASDAAGNTTSRSFDVTVTLAVVGGGDDVTAAWEPPFDGAVPFVANGRGTLPLKGQFTLAGAAVTPPAEPRLVLERLTACDGTVVERLDGGAFAWSGDRWKVQLRTGLLTPGCWRASVAVGGSEGGSMMLLVGHGTTDPSTSGAGKTGTKAKTAP
jgi:HYR domain-containing protein